MIPPTTSDELKPNTTELLVRTVVMFEPNAIEVMPVTLERAPNTTEALPVTQDSEPIVIALTDFACARVPRAVEARPVAKA